MGIIFWMKMKGSSSFFEEKEDEEIPNPEWCADCPWRRADSLMRYLFLDLIVRT